MFPIGIDLGTTNSLIAAFKDGKPELIPNRLGQVLTPSVVHWDGAGLVTGATAKARLETHPEQTVAAFKRAMGTDQSFAIGPRGKGFSAVELSAAILRDLKADAEHHLGGELSDVVISVPAYFNEIQRQAVKAAAEVAGLTVRRLINEPTAAALAYGLENPEEEETILVVDLGGGTFDVSVLESFEGVMEVRATAGDAFLGGEDFTAALVAEFAREVTLASAEDKGRMAALAERAKQALSAQEEVELTGQFGETAFTRRLTRAAFEQITASQAARLLRPIQRVLHDAKLGTGDVDRVVFVGGATRMPFMRGVVGKMMHQLPLSTIDPDHVVALGAAVQAGFVAEDKALADRVMTDVTAFSLGIETSNSGGRHAVHGLFQPIIERNTVVPCSRERVFHTMAKGQRMLDLRIYQGESPLAAHNVKLGEFTVHVPHNPTGFEAVAVRFSFDASGLLEVDARVLSNNMTYSHSVTSMQGALNSDEIETARKRLAKLKVHPRDLAETQHVEARLEQAYCMAHGPERDYFMTLIIQFRQVVDQQDAREIEALSGQLLTEVAKFEANYVQ